MVLVLTSIIAGSVITLGARRRKIASPPDVVREERWPWIRGIKKSKVDLSDRAKQTFSKARTFIDEQSERFFGDHRSEHVRELETEGQTEQPTEPKKSAAEADIDHHLKVAVSGSAIAIVGALTHTPLVLLSVPFSLYTCLPLVKVVYQGVREQKKLRGPIIDLVALGASFATHYYVLTSVSCTLMCAAEKLVHRIQGQSHRDMAEMFKRQNPCVSTVVDNETREVPLVEVRVGDILIVVAGGTIPIDGVIISGSASIDQHMLTGESRPVEKMVGDTVLAATLVLAGKIEIRVEKTGEDTISQQIGVVLDEIADYRERQELRCDETADKLVWPTLGAGALTQLALGLRSAVTVVACNFTETLRIAYPLAAMSFLNLAAKQGILVKDARALEMLASVDTLLFDKTGTLTLPEPHVGELHPAQGVDEKKLLRYAASAEIHQTHPIARAIQAEARARGIKLIAAQEISYDLGHGLRVILDEPTASLVRVGSARLMAREGIAIPETFQALETQCHAQGHSLVYVAIGAALAGAIELHPTLRPDVEELMQKLKMRGVSLYLISGDHPRPTERLAEKLQFDGFRAEVLPAEKAQFIEQLQREGRKVCYVGDGINDAIALKRADVSISLRGATTVATDIAQIILMDQNLGHIEQLLELAGQLDANHKRSLAAMALPSVANLVGALFFKFGIGSSILLFNSSLFAGVLNGLSPVLHDVARTRKISESTYSNGKNIPRTHAIAQYPAFKRIEPGDQAEIEAYVRRFPPYSHLSFASLYAYDFSSDTQLSWLHGNLVVRSQDFTTMKRFYSFLGTQEVMKTIETLLLRAQAEGLPPELFIVPEICLVEQMEQLREKFDIREDEACFDYILNAQELVCLSTNNAHPRAADIQRFLRAHPDVLVTQLDLANAQGQQLIRELFELWVEKKNKSNEQVRIERRAIDRILSLNGQLELLTFGAFLGDQLVAFTINEVVQGGYYLGHFGKADPQYRGLGLYLEEETAKRMTALGCQWMNYEEDLGAPGLRAYKRALNPVAFLKKYTIGVKSPS